MRIEFLIVILSLFISGLIQAEIQTIQVEAGDTEGLIAAVETANASSFTTFRVEIVPGSSGDTEFVFNEPAAGSDNALPDLTGDLQITVSDAIIGRVTLRTADEARRDFRLITISYSGSLEMDRLSLEFFGTREGNGGAIFLTGSSSLLASEISFFDNFAAGDGGAIAAEIDAVLYITQSEFQGNQANGSGGAISLRNSPGYAYSAVIYDSTFYGNYGSLFGCAIHLDSSKQLFLANNLFKGGCHSPIVRSKRGSIRAQGNTYVNGRDGAVGVEAGASIQLFSNIFMNSDGESRQQSFGTAPKPEDSCEGGGSRQSFGHNISPDASCGLDHPSDMPNADPQMLENKDGIPIPQKGSPVIDGGAVEAMLLGDDELASLPCGYVDVLGNARPQDGNGDGVFECDIGAVEIVGAGKVTDAHSGAFYNLSRDGEGTYVEVLSDDLAVVYTFTYRPDGSGPAWFIGVGRIVGNSIIIDELLRPTGTSFGDGFDPAEIEFTEIGGMSMVFPDCASTSPGGNVAYSGDFELGYEGLITKAQRLSHITGCGPQAPHAKVGLSGSYFDSARDGEGIIVEWLTSGDVLVVFFTYDQDGNQLWLLGIGTPVGNTVTMDALYASSVTSWGSNFDPSEISITKWGTFTLTWTECNGVTFMYTGEVGGYGSAMRNYTRLSKLQNTECPGF